MSDGVKGQIEKGIRSFILGGNAEFTIFQEPNIQYKYTVRTKDNMAFLYMSGKYQGFIVKEQGKFVFRIGKKGNRNFDTRAVNGLLWVLNHGDNLPEAVKVYHHGKCSVCGRKLTDSESIRRGIGPVCMEKVKGW